MRKRDSIRLLLMLVLATTLQLAAQNLPPEDNQGLPQGWMQAPGSKDNPTLWECAGRAGSWVVSEPQGSLAIKELDVERAEEIEVPPLLKLTEEMRGRKSLLRTANGWLIGFDEGEFGGGLWWFSGDGSDSKKLLSTNVHAIYDTRNGTFVLAGLAHMGHDAGEVDQFIETPEKVTLKWVASLGGSPEASTVDPDGDIIVASPRRVVRVDYSGEVHTLYRSGEDLTYPTSVVIDPNGDIFVGMRFFVLRLRPVDTLYRPQWLMRKSCRSFKTVEYICSCTGKD
jgi:hypothetical protein